MMELSYSSSSSPSSSSSSSSRTLQPSTIVLMFLSFLVGYSFKTSVNLSASGVRSLDTISDEPTIRTAATATATATATLLDTAPDTSIITTTTTPTIASTSASTSTSASALTPGPVCDGFFTVLADVWADSESNCTTLYGRVQDLLEEHDEQMGIMGSTFTVFTTWNEEQLKEDKCAHYFDYLNHTKFVQFDPEALLLKHGFTDTQINWMKHWQDTVPRLRHALTRLSDVFRIVLQREHNMAYADLDVVYLMNDKRVYLDVPNVAVPVWKEEQGAMEIQNSAFCFNNPQLDVLMDNINTIMNERGDSQLKKNRYMYTGLGPNLFQHSLQKLSIAGPLHLYVTHSDDHWKVEDVSKLHENYGKFVWLHLDGSNRRRNRYRNKGQTYRQLVQVLKKACPPPNVTDILQHLQPSYTLPSSSN